MKNKVLINVYVPSIDEVYEIYIPINECVNKVKILLVKSINELCDSNLNVNTPHYLLDPETANIYDNSDIIRDTNIRNSKKIVLI